MIVLFRLGRFDACSTPPDWHLFLFCPGVAGSVTVPSGNDTCCLGLPPGGVLCLVNLLLAKSCSLVLLATLPPHRFLLASLPPVLFLAGLGFCFFALVFFVLGFRSA